MKLLKSEVCPLGGRVLRTSSGLWAGIAVILTVANLPEAKGNPIGPYQLSSYTLTNTLDGNGYAITPDAGVTLILTGPNSGSDLPGATDLTIAAPETGLFQFSYQYSSLDLPGYDYAGYILGDDFFQLADTDGQSGSVSFPVIPGTNFGFRVGTVDNQGEPGVLSVRQMAKPGVSEVPEPGSATLFLIATGAMLLIRQLKRGRGPLLGFTPQVRNRLTICVLAAAASAPLLAQQQTTYTGQPVSGQLALIRTVNLRQLATARRMRIAIIRPEIKPKAPPKRLRPPMTILKSGATLASIVQSVQPVRSLIVSSAPNSLGFPGLSHLDQREANSGNQWSIEPPNLNIAVANNYILQGVNNAVHVFDISGAPVLPIVLASNQVFGLAPAIDRETDVNGPYLTDMRVFYDQGIDRWFILQRGQDNDLFGNPLNSSHIYLAVSRTGDAAGDYNIYIMDTTNAQNPGCPCIADYPQIGSDQFGFHIAWNEFTSYSERFLDTVILSVSKASLSNGAAAPTAARFLIPYITGYEFAIQPATTPPGASNFLGSGGLAYFVSSRANYSIGDHVALWAMTNTSSLATQTPNPTLSQVLVPTLTYSVPPVATQRPGPLPYGSTLWPPGQLPLLDGGDCRLQSLSYAGGRLFLTLQSRVQDERNAGVVGGAYIVLAPTYRAGRLAGTVLNQGFLFVNNNHLLRPSLAVNAQGRGAVAVTLVGPDWFPSAAYIPLETFTAPSNLHISSLGTLPEDGFTGYPGGHTAGVARWGDYNSAVAANDGSIWMGVQFVGSYPRTEFANWNTLVIRKKP